MPFFIEIGGGGGGLRCGKSRGAFSTSLPAHHQKYNLMASPAPEVSVVMAVYNERPYLKKSIQSVLDQTFGDFEFIIVNDGSTDGSKEVLDQFEQSDDRIRLVHQENRGIVASSNRGLGMARGKYIARMDGDDINLPERFERQVNFLEVNPEVGIVGTQIERIDADGDVKEDWERSFPTDPEVVSWRLLFYNCLCHASMMARRSVLEDLGGYAEWATHAEDYELFTRAVLRTRLMNLNDTLFRRRWHGGSVTVNRQIEQIQRAAEAADALHRAILEMPPEKQNAKFLVWMQARDIERAIQETAVEDFASVHEHLRSLYRACARRFFTDESNTQVQRRALRKLDTVANQVVEAEGKAEGMLHKLRSWSILSSSDVVPLVWRVFLSRLFR